MAKVKDPVVEAKKIVTAITAKIEKAKAVLSSLKEELAEAKEALKSAMGK